LIKGIKMTKFEQLKEVFNPMEICIYFLLLYGMDYMKDTNQFEELSEAINEEVFDFLKVYQEYAKEDSTELLDSLSEEEKDLHRRIFTHIISAIYAANHKELDFNKESVDDEIFGQFTELIDKVKKSTKQALVNREDLDNGMIISFTAAVAVVSNFFMIYKKYFEFTDLKDYLEKIQKLDKQIAFFVITKFITKEIIKEIFNDHQRS
jgi:hypothetical protein